MSNEYRVMSKKQKKTCGEKERSPQHSALVTHY